MEILQSFNISGWTKHPRWATKPSELINPHVSCPATLRHFSQKRNKLSPSQKEKIAQHKTNTNKYLKICFFFQFWGTHSEVEFLDHIVILSWGFWGTTVLFSDTAMHRPQALHIITNVCCFLGFYYCCRCYPNGSEICHCGFDQHLLYNYWSFMLLWAICRSLEKYLSRPFAHFFILFFCCVMRVFY